MRALILDHQFRGGLMVEAFLLNAVFFTISVLVFLQLLQSARRNGSLMQTGE
jgi:ABC-2 type transport system permease protein